MTWLAAIALALAAFALGAFALGLAKGLWSSMLAALALGLAGYALQASPDVPSAPKSGPGADDAPPFDVVEARREMLGAGERSQSDFVLVADALTRQGRYADAAQLLAGATRENAADFEAWLAQGNALVEHTEGVLTPAALYSYRQAALLKPGHIAPSYFLGVALIRQGRMMEARQVWRDALELAPADAAGRDLVDERLARLETMLGVRPPDQAEPTPVGE
jgi:cytochrome c-type biogenesis protein CcmH